MHAYDFNNVSITRPWSSLDEIDLWVRNNIPVHDSEMVNIYTGNDTDWRWQAFFTSFSNYRLNLFEGGIGAYLEKKGWNHSFNRQIVRLLFYKPLLMRRYRNIKGIFTSSADNYFAFRQFAFPLALGSKISEKKVNLLSFKNSQYTDFIRQNYVEYRALQYGKHCLVLSEPLAQFGVISEECEELIYEKIAFKVSADDMTAIWIKRHPRENINSYQRKIRILKKVLKGTVINEFHGSAEAFEVALICGAKLSKVLGIMSSALINAKLIDTEIDVLSLSMFLPRREQLKHAPYINVLRKLNVDLPG